MQAKLLTLVTFLAATPAFSATRQMPWQVDCRRVLTDGSALVHDFDFRPVAGEPGAYDVGIWIAKAPPFQGDPNTPVSSDDPDTGSRWQVLTRATYRGHVGGDGRVVYFDGQEGFVRFDGERGTLQLPGSRLPELLENCVIPE